MPIRKSKTKNIDPDLLPESITKPGPHEPLIKYFTEEEPPKELFDQWADFYEKKPLIAIRELISVVLFIASGIEIEISDNDIKKCRSEEIIKALHDKLEEFDADAHIPVDDFIKGTNEKAYKFWTELCNSLIVSKGLFSEEFDVFIKDWAFAFCEANDRTLRSASTIAICSILNFLAESIKDTNAGLEKFKKSNSKSKSNKSTVTQHQIEKFETELDNSRTLSRELFTSVLKPRLRDVVPKIREICIQTMGELSKLAPEDYSDMNFIKLLGNALTDESSKNRKQAIKQIESILTSSHDLDTYKPFFKSISPTLIKICYDTDNTLVVSVFELMSKMLKKEVFECDDEQIDSIFKITGDDADKVRNHAAKFFTNYLFKGTLLEDENLKGGKKNNKQAINEAQLNEFARLSDEFSDSELTNSIQAFSSKLDCFQNWDLISEIIISSNDKSERVHFAKILSISASFATDDDVESLTIAMVTHLQKQKSQGLLDIFKKNNNALTALSQILQYMDINVLSGAAQERQFKLLLEKLHELFISNNTKAFYTNIINGIHSWCKNATQTKGKKKQHSMAQLANSELESIAEDFTTLKDGDETKLDKFLAMATFHDYSENKELRDFLKEAIDSEDNDTESNHAVSTAIRCLEKFYMWDVKRLKDKSETEKAEYYIEFDSLQKLFITQLNSQNLEIKTAAFCALGTFLALSPFVANEIDVDSNCFETFIDTFHDLENNKLASFKSLIRPILSRVIPMKYAIHAFWYLQDNDIKPLVKDFMEDINENDYPIDGSEIGRLISIMIKKEANGSVETFAQPSRISKIKTVMKAIATKVTAKDAILSYINNNNGAEELIPAYSPIFENMSYSDAEFVKPSAEGRILKIINKIIKGKTLKPKDFVVIVKKPKESSESENDEAESEGTD